MFAIARCNFQTGPSAPGRAMAALLLYQLLALYRLGVGDGMAKVIRDQVEEKSLYIYIKRKIMRDRSRGEEPIHIYEREKAA